MQGGETEWLTSEQWWHACTHAVIFGSHVVIVDRILSKLSAETLDKLHETLDELQETLDELHETLDELQKTLRQLSIIFKRQRKHTQKTKSFEEMAG